MTTRRQKTIYLDVAIAVRRTGLSRHEVAQALARGLVKEPLRDADLVELRRVRRLQELGVNLAGIEIIMHMRRRIQALEAELAGWERRRGKPEWPQLEDSWQRLLAWDRDGE
jgi:hypothetical protein